MSEEIYNGIAIVGMAGRFPGADSVEEFWANLVAGKESISFFSDAELAESGFDPAELRKRGHYVPARGLFKDADCFDAAFFGVHPKEAEVIDPQHRVFLEACWVALERAGYAPNRMSGAVGIFAGATFNTYFQHVLQPRPDLTELIGAELVMFGNEKDYMTTRVAYKLGLKGPALSISTACSTSLVAVCQACRSLLTYESDVALAGGVSVTVPQKRGYYFEEGYIGSPDGHTRTFDEKGAGTVFSNGVAVVVLKRLEDAVRDHDQVYAVIKGAALNNDGSQRVSFGAPGIEGQSEAIAMAHALAEVDPATITYVEAHGTATPLGDPIEIAALTKAFRLATNAKQYCGIGSVKSNIGHLDAAAGVAGLIKVALALRHRVIPASLHFEKPNPKIDLENSPFFVNAELRDWKVPPGIPRRAGVSSFGSGGTNAHVVVEEAPDLPASGPSRLWQLLPISAKTPEALDRATADLTGYLKRIADGSENEKTARELADAAFTLQTGRGEFIHRRVVVCQDPADGAAVLQAGDPKRVFTHRQDLRDAAVVFMFPGQGAQYPGMGAELYRTEPVFRAEVDRCADVLRSILHDDIRRIMFPVAGGEKESDALLIQTKFTQPALFVIEYALAKLWMSWGIKPTAMIGHSVGEYVAGCLAGVFSLDEALMLVARRGALVQAQPGGAMLAIRLPEKDVLPLLPSETSIAAINSPTLCVASGPYESITALEKQLEAKGVKARRLHTSHAFHSVMMEPVLEPFCSLLRSVRLGAPSIPYVSNVSAKWITQEEAQTPEYWAGHVRQTVRFADGVAQLMKDPTQVLLEVGPGQTLCTLARQHPDKQAEQPVLASLPLTGDQELRGLTETLGRLWMVGVTIDWHGYYANEHRRRVVLPTYPFERKRYWPDAPQGVAKEAMPSAVSVAPACGEYVPTTPSLTGTQSMGANSAVMASRSEQTVPRRERLLTEIRGLMQELSGYDLSAVDASADLLELGLDSLLLTQAAQLIQRKFSVKVSFRQLMEELSSLEAIVSHLDAAMPPDVPSQVPSTPVVPMVHEAATSGAVPQSVLEQILLQQQQLSNQILQLMGRQPVALPSSAAAVPPLSAPASPTPSAPPSGKSHGPFKPFDKHAGAALSDEQKRALDALITRYTQRTAGSKTLAGKHREIVADPRSVAGFNRLWKEMVYPIVTTRSEASNVWDVDGNEYVDFVMGFGASLFGHRPPFLVDAIHKQLDIGFEIGPIQPLVYEVATLMKEFTGMSRYAFTNTGSEAVLGATRVARTVTGRDKIAVFAGAYHGIFDEVLFRPLMVNGELRTAAIAPGIPNSALEQVIVLDYANPQSLEILRARGHEIAAVLVEPVQSRRLDLQPKEFLHELRRVTHDTGTALVFDEIVMGFRVHPGGAQGHFGVRADLATYGKVVGGGVPIGVLAGDAKYMDALDGGQWQYGDTSFPEVGVTFFAGTFVRHPLALAAAKSVLIHLKQQGPDLQRRLADRTTKLAAELRAVIEEFQAPYQLAQFSGLMTLTYAPDQKLAGLLFYLLRYRGVLIWDNRNFIITTAHTESDLVRLVTVFRECLAEMYASGFLVSSVGQSQPSSAAGSQCSTAALSYTHRPPERSGQLQVGRFPLTEAQKEIWLATQMGDHAAVAYNESFSFDFRGSFDIEAFSTALRQVVQRHPILLAKISGDGQWQEVDADRVIDVPVTDLSVLKEVDRQKELNAIVDREAAAPFDLAKGPLLRARVVRLSSEQHVVMWNAHHIVCDGWSTGVLVRELAKVYSALKQGGQPTLDEPVPFRDYAVAIQQAGPSLNNAVEYWKRQLTDIPPPLDLPTDRGRPLVRSAGAATLIRSFDGGLYQSLKRTAGQQRTTMVVLLMTAIKTLIYRLTGQMDLVIGLPVAGQAVTGKNSLVGHCVSLLPIRTHLRPEAGFHENLALVKKSVLDAYDHHQCTIGTILQHVNVPRHAGRQPLVEVIFNVDRDSSTEEFSGVKFVCERNPKRAMHYDIFFNFVEGPRGLHVECDYNTDLFDAGTIERWLGHYQTLLEHVAAKPSEQVGMLPIMTDSERIELVRGWNDPSVEFPKNIKLHELFEAQAKNKPKAHAATAEGLHLTYGELNRRANLLAHRLKSMGAGPDVLVGLFLERSLDMLVGILGILKTGAAYVPMDPEYPKERLGYILEDSHAPLVVTKKTLANQLPGFSGQLICLDVDWTDIAKGREDDLISDATPQNLAYVLFTSGSTGRPKGVAIEHHSAVTFVQWASRVFSADELSGVLFSTSVCFDLSIFELFVTLNAGGTVIIAPNALHLPSLSEKKDVTLINTVPSAITELLHMGGVPPSVKVVNLAGEALSDALVEQIYAQTNVQKVYNLYGPTEATTYSTYTLVSRGAPVTIGRPITNTQAYVLDTHRNLVPRGVLGELYLAGEGLARGYYGRPDLTDERFVANPFAGQPGARMYRTGDLCRWLPDKSIQYLGRLDHQIKLRGFRIELGEIEATLDRLGGVRQSLVLAREDRPGQKMLVAYVVPEAGQRLEVEAIRLHLKQRLPDFMVPSSFIVMEAFPLSPNGKINRAALPAPPDVQSDRAAEHVAPRNPIEQMLICLWSKILKVKHIGVGDNFFELGGHSILAVRIIIEIEKLYGKRLPLATLIQAPTIEKLAQIIQQKQWAPLWSSLVPIRGGGGRPPLFLFHSHGGNVLEYYPLADLLDADQPVYALQARGLEGRIAPNQSMEGMVEGYLKEMRSLQPEGPYYLAGFCFGGLAALEAARQLSEAGEHVALVGMIQTTYPHCDLFPGMSIIEQWWHQAKKMADLEWDNFQHRGVGHVKERIRRIIDVVGAKAAIALEQFLGKSHGDYVSRSMPYILERLAIEHERVYQAYRPRPYAGAVVLFRTRHQLPGPLLDRSLGWSNLLGAHFEVCDVPGHQQNLLLEPHIHVLARELMNRLKHTQKFWADQTSRSLVV